MLHKVDFAINGKKVNEHRYLNNPNKGALISNKGKTKIDDFMDIRDEEEEEDMEEDNYKVAQDDDLLASKEGFLEIRKQEQDEKVI
jgi:hypothetical protein